jgi:gp32 DNA binding protein like
MDFATLKKSRSSELEKLAEQLKKVNNTEGNTADDRFWYPDVDKAGNGYAIIRFLPPPGEEESPFVRIWNHAFKGKTTGLWYIENSLTTLGKSDPVVDYNTKLWNSTTDDNSPARKQARDQKRKLTYISNVYVVSDPAKPQNEGKVFLFKYGKKIFDKLNEAMFPQFADEKPLNPFDMWDGANFKIKIRQVEGYRNYDKSEFADRGPLLNDDDALEKIWKSTYSLQAFLDPKNFKDYDTLKEKLNNVLGLTAKKAAEFQEDAPTASAPEPRRKEQSDPVAMVSSDEEDDDLSYFSKLANE